MNGLSKSENCPQDASIIEEEDPFAFHSYLSFELEGVSDDKCRNISFCAAQFLLDISKFAFEQIESKYDMTNEEYLGPFCPLVTNVLLGKFTKAIIFRESATTCTEEGKSYEKRAVGSIEPFSTIFPYRNMVVIK